MTQKPPRPSEPIPHYERENRRAYEQQLARQNIINNSVKTHEAWWSWVLKSSRMSGLKKREIAILYALKERADFGATRVKIRKADLADLTESCQRTTQTGLGKLRDARVVLPVHKKDLFLPDTEPPLGGKNTITEYQIQPARFETIHGNPPPVDVGKIVIQAIIKAYKRHTAKHDNWIKHLRFNDALPIDRDESNLEIIIDLTPYIFARFEAEITDLLTDFETLADRYSERKITFLIQPASPAE